MQIQAFGSVMYLISSYKHQKNLENNMRINFSVILNDTQRAAVTEVINGWFPAGAVFALGANLANAYVFTVENATVQQIQGAIAPHIGQAIGQVGINLISVSYQNTGFDLGTVVDRSLTDAQTYSLTFQNRSNNDWSFLCFQNQPTGLPSGYFPLAWFSFPVASDAQVKFKWSIDYSFVWSQTGELQPGIQFNAGQILPADLTSKNAVTFTRLSDKAFKFINATQGTKGVLTIAQDPTIPSQIASVGIGMSNTPSYVVQAQPNINATFEPNPHYYVAFGVSIDEGQVLNISQFSQIKEIAFPPNLFAATVTLQADNTWSNPTYS